MNELILTKEQIAAAKKLFEERPPVLAGTRVVLDRGRCEDWYAKVSQEMRRLGVTNDRTRVKLFCDIAGVPE